MKISIKQLLIITSVPFLVWGCSWQDSPKTEETVLNEVSHHLMLPLNESLTEYINFIPEKYKSSIKLEGTILNSPKEIDLKNANLSIAANSESDETDFSKYQSKGTLKIKTEGLLNQNGQDVSWKGEAEAMVRIVDDALWFYLSKAFAESSMLPISIVPSSEVTGQWYTITFEELNKVLNKYLSTSGLEDVNTFSILDAIEKNSLSMAKKDLQFFQELFSGKSCFKIANSTDPETLASISEDNENYLIDIELDKARINELIEASINRFEERVANGIGSDPELINELTDELMNKDFGTLSGKLTVNKKESTLFKFEGTYITPNEEDEIAVLIDALTPNNLTIKLLDDINEGISLTNIDKNITITIYEDDEEFVVVSGILSKEAITIDIFEPEKETDNKIATFILNQDPETKNYTGSLAVPNKEFVLKINKLIATPMNFEIETIINIEEKDLLELMFVKTLEAVSVVNVKIPDKNIKQINVEKIIEQAGSMIMGGLMSGGMGGMPPMMNPQVNSSPDFDLELAPMDD